MPDMDKMNKYWRPAMNELIAKGKDTPWLAAMMERYQIQGWEKLNYREWATEYNLRAPQIFKQQELL